MSVSSIPALRSWQRRTVVIAWITYAAYYLGRVNISTAIPDLESSLSLSKSQIGLLSTGFFWAYAAGQLVNGQLGDRLSPRRFVFFGMLGSAALNMVFGWGASWVIMFAAWTLNGYFQATGWGPILRTLANWLTPLQRRKISGAFGSSFVAGNAITWVLTGVLVANYGWRAAFWIPGLLLAVAGLFWYRTIQDTPEAAGKPPLSVRETESEPDLADTATLARNIIASFRKFWTLVVAAIFLGFNLVSLILWLPTYFVEVAGLNIGSAAALASLIPFAGILGTLLAGWLIGRYMIHREAEGLGLLLILLAGALAIFPAISVDLLLSAAMLMLVGSLAYGASSLLLTTMPLALGGREQASSTAGLIDFSFNIGGGLSGFLVGSILDAAPWNAVFWTLAMSSVLAAAFVWITVAWSRLATR